MLVGVGSPTMSKIAYPFNLNIESPLLSDWFFGTLYTTYVQGKRSGVNKTYPRIPKLLGKGKYKLMSKTSKNLNAV